ncbi:MAG: arsenate reductase [Bacteroidia bacterium]|jgi:arsenate reductase
MSSQLLPELQAYSEARIKEFESIPETRKAELKELSEYIQRKLESAGEVSLNFICTHNSRRSHLTQIWASLAAFYYGIESVKTYSGGTEATAFNPNAVAALLRAGLEIENPGGENPLYQVRFSEDVNPLTCFSKTFDDAFNPSKGFAAIMTCSSADEACPTVTGADFRLALTYRDPKEGDGTPLESKIYDKRCAQIARELFYVFYILK